jgi:hypothetical protein
MFRFARCWGVVLVALALVMPAQSTAQDKKADDPKKSSGDSTAPVPKAKPKAKEKVKADWSNVIAGKLTELKAMDDKVEGFTVQVTLTVGEPDFDAQKQLLQQQQQLLRQQTTLAGQQKFQDRQNTGNQIAQTMMEIQKTQARLVKYKDVKFDVKCNALEQMRVRYFQPQQPIDTDTGEFIKLNKEQLDLAKGPEGYPGYKADSKLLQVGQGVQVYFSKDTKTPASLLDKKGKGSNKKVDDLQNEINNFRYDVIMIAVVVDAPKENK